LKSWKDRKLIEGLIERPGDNREGRPVETGSTPP